MQLLLLLIDPTSSMYPAQVFELFPPFPRDNVVFVAMSFDKQFTARWSQVIAPGISRVMFEGQPLQPRRVDETIRGDSIHTEILKNIANARLIFADITTIGLLQERPIRNANVLYEVGLAHACRQPQEVLVFRSDRDELPFDVIGIRAFDYDPDENPAVAQDKVFRILTSALGEVEMHRAIAVSRALDALGADAIETLLLVGQKFQHPQVRTLRDLLSTAHSRISLQRLLDAGLITAIFGDVADAWRQDLSWSQFVHYEATAFGLAVVKHLAERIHLTEEILAASDALPSDGTTGPTATALRVGATRPGPDAATTSGDGNNA